MTVPKNPVCQTMISQTPQPPSKHASLDGWQIPAPVRGMPHNRKHYLSTTTMIYLGDRAFYALILDFDDVFSMSGPLVDDVSHTVMNNVHAK